MLAFCEALRMLPSGTTSTPRFDTASLQAPVTRAEVRDFRAEVHGNAVHPGMARATAAVVASIVAYGLLGIAIELLLAGLPISIVFTLGESPVPGLVTTAVLVPLVGWILWRWSAPKVRLELAVRGSWTRRLRLDRFAEATGFDYYPELRRPDVIGTVFATGTDRVAWDVFDSPAVQVGNYRTGDRYNQSVAPSGWSYLRIRLDTGVPHLLLLPRASRIPARVIAPVRGDQELHLEGDFDRYFRLFVPAGYERDALYVITPDLMALLIDRIPGAFVEMIGRHLTIAVPRPRDAALASSWNDIALVLATVGRKAVRQTHRYQDERSPVRGSVAASGRSLRWGIPIASVVGLLVLAAQLYRLIHGF